MFRINLGKGHSKTRSPIGRQRPVRQYCRLSCEALEDRFLLTAKAAWTVMVYFTADTKLAADLNGNIRQLESTLAQLNVTNTAGSVQIAVLYDQSQVATANLSATPIATPTGTLPAQTWSNTGEAILQPNAASPVGRGVTTPFTLLGPQNSGQPAVLSQFVTWAATNAPAQHYALIFEDHGAGWRGFNNYNDDALNTPGIATVLNAAATAANPVKFDLIGFDECLMSDAQAEDALASSTPVIVASEELESGTGWNFTTSFSALNTADPGSVTATQLATSIVNSYTTQYVTGPVNGAKKDDTLSAVQTSGLANLDTALQAFTAAALSPTTTAADWNIMSAARNLSPWYSETQPEAYRDLGTFLNNVAAAPGVSPALQTAAANASKALSAAIITKTADSRQSSGLSVYFPAPGETLNTNYFDPGNAANPGLAALFVSNTNWYNFLVAFLKNAPAQPTSPAGFSGGGTGRSAANAFDLNDLIGPDNTFTGLSLPIGAAPQDEAWFQFNLTAAGMAGNAVTATYDQGGGTVHLSLFDQNSNLLGESNTGSGQESIGLAGLPAGDYFVLVESGNGEDVPDYTLAVNAPTPAVIPPGLVSGNGSQATAYNLGSIPSVAEFSGLTLQDGATAWFQFELDPDPTPADSGPSSLTVEGGSDQALTVQVLDISGNVLASKSGSESLNLSVPQVDGGQYFLEVSGAAGGYALHFNAPLLDANSLEVSESPILAGQAFTLSGSVQDIAEPVGYTIQVNWGDGSAQSTLTLGAGINDFKAAHTYSQAGSYPIVVTAVDASGITGSGTIKAAVEQNSTVTPPPVVTDPEKQLLPLTLAFVNSPEFERSFVTHEFQFILQRGPEDAALSYWVSQMQAGLTQEGLTADLLSSQEFIGHAGGGAAWIGDIYKTLFNRQGDTAGLAFWDAQLKNGMSPLAISQAFAASPEGEEQNISALYTADLGRPVDQAGMSFWLAEADKTGRIENVAAGLLASSEYYNGAKGGAGNSAQWLDAVYSLLFNRQPSTTEESFWFGQI